MSRHLIWLCRVPSWLVLIKKVKKLSQIYYCNHVSRKDRVEFNSELENITFTKPNPCPPFLLWLWVEILNFNANPAALIHLGSCPVNKYVKNIVYVALALWIHLPEPETGVLRQERRRFGRGLQRAAQTSVSQHVNLLINVNICIHRSIWVLLPVKKRRKHKLNLFQYSENLFRTFFRSRIEPLPNTDILHIVSSCSRFNELPFGPNSFPTKLNCKSQFKSCYNLVSFALCVLK